MQAIEVNRLSKRYRLGASNVGQYKTVRDAIARLATRLIRRELAPKNSADETTLWALRDVTFEVEEGEALGIIGRNGAGKSTLLKILSRITEPTEGSARLHGRVASLLEVGTGFHPELTGRENIFLNGTILGMTRSEISRHFDEIVAFAEVERFIDTPVKYYSSGMYVRLAFAVAAHLTPEILIVDEVLAVGDHEFQRRCLGRMNSVAHSGRTVLFVSHNMAAIEELCSRTLLLDHGTIDRFGPTREVIGHYLSSRAGRAQWDFGDDVEREGTGRARIRRIELLSSDGASRLERVAFGEEFRLRLHYSAEESIPDPRVGLALLTPRDERVFLTETTETPYTLPPIDGDGWVDCVVRSPNVLPGTYCLEAWIIDVPNVSFADHLRMVGTIEIVVGDWQESSAAFLSYPDRGRMYVRCQWLPRNGQDGGERKELISLQ